VASEEVATGEFIPAVEQAPPNTIVLSNKEVGEIVRIEKDGTFRVKVDPTDVNARMFIECVNRCLETSITKVEGQADNLEPGFKQIPE
jgi:hypothetical protein